jgi:hypothetical protein
VAQWVPPQSPFALPCFLAHSFTNPLLPSLPPSPPPRPLAHILTKPPARPLAGIDTSHPDLQDNIGTIPKEIPDNGKDDDGNGYVDDVHGARGGGGSFPQAAGASAPMCRGGQRPRHHAPLCPPSPLQAPRPAAAAPPPGWDFVNDRPKIDPVVGAGDDHGTVVAGILGAVGGNGIGIVGVAPHVKM